jgi:hypothetical protein
MAKNNGLTINISPDTIIGSEIMKNRDYKYATLAVKLGDKEFMRVSYEWQGDGVPDFVMGIMSWMQSSENQEAIKNLKETNKELYNELKERFSKNLV